ncbi:MAG: penicillin-binding protein 2 [Rhodospirillaceae bacterium]|nr:penicillin-binding protein 2 [Rhodospirillaceae bacterium]MBT5239941.1 penicillin-binding protein 2 [Rhodospirillaceae bacterium]MBT5564397.1 penicillin-binding protein 2 [Rhodospirillaceae bacterium]MBT6090040.1 penicillin-binding protein 2 [Rhodospirillaceae bacterium]
MNRDNDRIRLFNRRAVVLGGGQSLLVSALVGRMYYLQVIEADRYRMLAEENRINLRLLPPPRGRVLDRFGEPLAVNRQNFRVLIVSEQTRDLAATLDALADVIDLSEYDRDRVQKEVRRRRSFVPITVRENLDWEEMARIQVNAPDLPGVIVDEGLTRHYPQTQTAAHVLGYVSSVDEDDLTGDPLLQLPGFRIGKAGMEQKFDLALRGAGGTSQVEVNAVGRVIRELERKEGEAGTDLMLTLDERLQRYTSERLGAESAASVVMDIHTGEVLVMASTPSYDPNAFNRGLTQREWNALSGDPRAPMTNKAISGQYSPGSTFKMIVALAALEQGAITPEQTVSCKGYTDLGNRRVHCWEKRGHGAMDMVQAIAQSCDVYFYEVAGRVGVDRIAEMANRLGLGSSTGVGLAGERAGLIPTEAWKRATLGETWQKGDTFNVGIGQGHVLTTPLQLAVMTARLSTGLAVEPVLTRQVMIEETVVQRPPQAFAALNLDPAHIAVARQGMFEVLNGPRGTARASKLKLKDVQMSGKTGTTQVKRITMAEREAGLPDSDDVPWNERTHALFVAYAPEDNPRYALSVIIEHGGGGASVAAPIARDIMTEVLKLDPSRKPRVNDDQVAGTQPGAPA